MRTRKSVRRPLVSLIAVICLALPSTLRAQPAGGSLSGVVLPDLPPEVSPGEVISFTPPAGSEGGTWTLSGVVAEEEPPAEPSEPPLPLPERARVPLKPSPGMPPLDDAQSVALALAAAIEQDSWSTCVTGRGVPATGAPAANRGGVVDWDVSLQENPTGSSAVRMIVSRLSPEQVLELKARSPVRGEQTPELGYYGVEILPSGDDEPMGKSFYESRSNTAQLARRPDAVLYSLDATGGVTEKQAEVATGEALFTEVPALVVAVGGGTGGQRRGPAGVDLIPVRCAPPAAAPLPAPVEVGLNLPAGGEPWTDEHLVALAVAAVGHGGPWSQCLGDDAGHSVQPRSAKDIDGIDVIIRKKPGGHASLAAGGMQIGVSEVPAGFAIDEKGVKRQQAAAAAVREILENDFAVRYFAVVMPSSGCPTCKSFYESRSNTARADSANYSIGAPAAALDVAVAGWSDLGPGAPPPATVVAASVSRAAYGITGKSTRVAVALAAAQCADSPRTPKRPTVSPDAVRNLVFTVAETLQPGKPLTASFRDPSGRTVIDERPVPGITVVPPRPPNPVPSIDAAPEFSIAGQTVCACGNYPDARSRHGFLLDEQAISALSASSRMAILPLAATVRPGRHPISGDPAAGFGAKDLVYTTVVNVGGSLDANSLRRGQATQMTLTIAGTDQPLQLEVENKTPAVISIGGQVVQVLTTSGGSPNQVVRKVDSVAPGNFNISFSLAGDRCPCQGGAATADRR